MQFSAGTSHFDFTLRGSEIQETFNIDKYVALAHGSPLGAQLHNRVETQWVEWVKLVDGAPWLRNWVRSPYKNDTYKLAECIYTEAVWQYGWIPSKDLNLYSTNSDTFKAFYKLQGVKKPNQARTYLFDDAIYRGTGLIIPCEVGTLDRWLETLTST